MTLQLSEIPSKYSSVDEAIRRLIATANASSSVINSLSSGGSTPSDNSVSTAKIQDSAVTTPKIADGAVTTAKIAAGAISGSTITDASIGITKFASGITPVEIVGTLPTTGNFDGRIVFLTTDKKLYRYDAGAAAFTPAVASVDITGQLGTSQIVDAAITQVKIAAAAVEASKLAIALANGLSFADARNRVWNPGFEDGSSYWTTGSGISFVTNSANAKTGNKYLEITASVSTDAHQQDDLGNVRFFEVRPGDVVKFGFYGQLVSGGGTCQMTLVSVDKDKANAVGHASTPISSGSWTLSTGEYTVGSTDKYVRIKCTASPSGASTFRFDDVFLIIETPGTDIVARSIQADRIVAGTITANEIQAGTITTSQIAAGTIAASNIAAGAIGTTQLAANAVTAAKIAANTITSAQIAADTITAGQIAAGAIGVSELAAGAVTAAAIAAGTITATQIAGHTITAAQIAAGTITTTEIASGTIVAGNIASGTITTTQIASGTIVAGNIASGTITATQIASRTITADRIQVGALSLKRLPTFIVARKSSSDVGNPPATSRLTGLGYSATQNLTATMSDCRAYDVVVIDCNGWAADEHNTFIQSLIADGQRVWVSGNDSTTGLFYITTTENVSPVGHAIPGSRSHPLTTGWTSISDTDSGNRITGVVAYALPVGAYTENANAIPLVVVPHPSGGLILHMQDLFAITGSDMDTLLQNCIDYLIGIGFVNGSGSITGTYITDGTIAAAKLVANTITAAQIAAGTITATQIAAGTITGSNIAAGTITASNIQSGTITATQIASGTITTTEIASHTITASNIAAGTITATEIAASTITASKLTISQLSAITADCGTITAGLLQNSGATAGVALSGSVPGGWTRYLNLIGTGSFLKHDKLRADYDGSLWLPKTVVVLTSGTSWSVPSDFNPFLNMVECIGGGAGGAGGVSSSHGGGGGGGGEYRKIVAFNPAGLASIPYAIGAGGGPGVAGGDTTWNGGTVIAKGGGTTASAAAGSGGTGGVGSEGKNGGSGGTGVTGTAGGGGGGGGAGGPHTAASSGGNAVTTTGGTGGAGGNPSGGGTASAGATGNNGTGTPASGSGGGGGNGTLPQSGSNGGNYGGGGGGGGCKSGTGSSGGSGIQGCIVITYFPIGVLP